MLNVAYINVSAESRNRGFQHFTRLIASASAQNEILPRVNLISLSLDELKYRTSPDICIIGLEALKRDFTEITRLKKLIGSSALFAELGAGLDSFGILEQAARLGADDVIRPDISAEEFFQKIILHARRVKAKGNSKLVVVDSAKGGLGVTSIVAGIGESLLAKGHKVALVDLDFESQDLSRFLQARPFINENLQLVLDNNRPITKESIEHCLSQVWEDEDNLFCMPPAQDNAQWYAGSNSYVRNFISVLEVLDSEFDFIVVDIGALKGRALETIYRTADNIIFLVSNDPAALLASAEKLKRNSKHLAVGAQLSLLEVNPNNYGLNSRLLRDELRVLADTNLEMWIPGALTFNVACSRWPGSGATLYSLGSGKTKRLFDSILMSLGLDMGAKQSSGAFESFEWFRGKRSKRRELKTNNLEIGSDKLMQPKLSEHAQKQNLALPQSEGLHGTSTKLPDWDLEDLMSEIKITNL